MRNKVTSIKTICEYFSEYLQKQPQLKSHTAAHCDCKSVYIGFDFQEAESIRLIGKLELGVSSFSFVYPCVLLPTKCKSQLWLQQQAVKSARHIRSRMRDLFDGFYSTAKQIQHRCQNYIVKHYFNWQNYQNCSSTSASFSVFSWV